MLKSMPKRPTFPQQEMADRLLQALKDSGVTQAEPLLAAVVDGLRPRDDPPF